MEFLRLKTTDLLDKPKTEIQKNNKNINGKEALREQLVLKSSQGGQFMAYKHEFFWQYMDYPKQLLEKQLARGNAPWKMWK